MAFGVRAPGPRHYLSARGMRLAQFSPEVWSREEYGYRNLPEFLDIIREVVGQGLVDIMLMSAYVNEQLAIKEGLFGDSHVTPAARANDTTDVWAVRHGCYTAEPAQPFRSATIDHIQCGKIECDRTLADFPGANLGLYSVTFVNDLAQDRATTEAFKAFREEAERKPSRAERVVEIDFGTHREVTQTRVVLDAHAGSDDRGVFTAIGFREVFVGIEVVET